ncbi:hypothetical protein WICPIJ_004007, partial [Wickerhamomyces pijperi]
PRCVGCLVLEKSGQQRRGRCGDHCPGRCSANFERADATGLPDRCGGQHHRRSQVRVQTVCLQRTGRLEGTCVVHAGAPCLANRRTAVQRQHRPG